MSRPIHYYFTNRLLKQYYFEDPEFIFDNLNRNDVLGLIFLTDLWHNALEAQDLNIEEDSLWEELNLKTSKSDDDLDIIIIRLPEPIEPVEAWFIGLTRQKGEQYIYRYFTLEYGLDTNHKPVTVFCEWQNDTHKNYGNGPEPDQELFSNKITEFLKQE